MAISVNTVPGTLDHDLRSASGAHAVMVAFDAHMVAIGMTPASFTGAYDPAGSSSQMPTTTVGTPSAWMAYNFSDADQTAYPITVWVRLVYGNFCTSAAGYTAYAPNFRVSEGVDGSGNPLGRTIENVPRSPGPAAGADSNNYRLEVYGSAGDFFRYTGDTLTVLMGLGGLGVGLASARSVGNLFELHIERPRHHLTNAVQAGFVGLVQPTHAAVPTTNFVIAPNPTTLAFNYTAWPANFVNAVTFPVKSTVYNDTRAGGPLALIDGTAAAVHPIMYKNADGRLVAFKRLFTIPTTAVTMAQLVTVDFTGAELKYLPYSVASRVSPAHQGGVSMLVEWE